MILFVYYGNVYSVGKALFCLTSTHIKTKNTCILQFLNTNFRICQQKQFLLFILNKSHHEIFVCILRLYILRLFWQYIGTLLLLPGTKLVLLSFLCNNIIILYPTLFYPLQICLSRLCKETNISYNIWASLHVPTFFILEKKHLIEIDRNNNL